MSISRMYIISDQAFFFLCTVVVNLNALTVLLMISSVLQDFIVIICKLMQGKKTPVKMYSMLVFFFLVISVNYMMVFFVCISET